MPPFHFSRGTWAKWRAWRVSQATKSTSVKARSSTTRCCSASSYSTRCSGQSRSACALLSSEKRVAQSPPADGS